MPACAPDPSPPHRLGGLPSSLGSPSHLPLDLLPSPPRSYVNTTTLRILWSLGASGTQRITLQHWRHSAVSEVLFQLDDESDINLARDFFSYNHFYVIWCAVQPRAASCRPTPPHAAPCIPMPLSASPWHRQVRLLGVG